MPYKYRREQRWEIIMAAASCLAAGFLYIILVLTLPLTCPVNCIILIVGVLLLLLSPTLLILTYKESWKPIAQKILKVIRIPLFTAVFLTIVYTVFRTGELLKNRNLSWLSLVLICYMILCFILLIIAETFAGRRR
jgi:NADH:ubiquinone oxidoreductase subunit K